MIDELDFEDVICQLDDFGLADSVSCAIESVYGYETLVNWCPTIPRSHRIVHVVWSATGFIEGAGFARFFAVECHHKALVEGYEAIGLSDLAASVQVDLQLIPAHCLGDSDGLETHFGSWGNVIKLTEPTQNAIFASHDRIISSVAKFIRLNKAEFVELLPTIQYQFSYLSKFHPDVIEAYHRSSKKQ